MTAARSYLLIESHNMRRGFTQLCEHGILLEDGQVKTTGPVKEVVQNYLKSKLNQNTAQAHFPSDPNKPCQYISAEIVRSDGELGSDFSCDEPVTIRLKFEIKEPALNVFLTISIHNLSMVLFGFFFSDVRDMDPAVTDRLSVGLHTFEISLPPRLLAPNTYVLSIRSVIRFMGVGDQHEACCEFALRDLSLVGTSMLDRSCVLGVLLPWHHERSSSANRNGSTEPQSSVASQV